MDGGFWQTGRIVVYQRANLRTKRCRSAEAVSSVLHSLVEFTALCRHSGSPKDVTQIQEGERRAALANPPSAVQGQRIITAL